MEPDGSPDLSALSVHFLKSEKEVSGFSLLSSFYADVRPVKTRFLSYNNFIFPENTETKNKFLPIPYKTARNWMLALFRTKHHSE